MKETFYRILGTLSLLAWATSLVLATSHPAHSTAGAAAKTSSPVPVEVTGTPNVSVANTPNVNVSNTPSVLIANPGALPVNVGTPTVQIGNTTASPVPVSVGNATLAVSNVNEPAKQPFQTRATVSLPAGAFTSSATIAVPSGKRLVVETVGMLRSPDATSKTESVQVEMDANFDGLITAYDLPFVSSNGTAFPGVTQSLHFYADGGTNLTAVCYRNGNSGAETDIVYVSGYLVNL